MLRWSRPGYALLLAVLVVAPLLRPGYLLLRDAVSTPRSYLSDSALGLSESAPRATPQDFAVALASHVIDGGVVVKTLLVVGLWLAGWGATRLAALVVPEAGAGGQFVATTVAIWNPYVAERLLQGHWSLLVGYGCLPWVATTMLSLRSAWCWRRLFALAFWIALAGLTPSGLLLAATVALACALWPRPRWLCAAAALGCAVLSALPWLVAAALGSSLTAQNWAQAPAIAAFAARAEPELGTLGSLAGLGGIWNADAVPPSRTTLFALVGTVVLLGIVVAGLATALRRPMARPLLVLAAVSIVVPALLATGVGQSVLHSVLDAVPGLGIVRDAQKWVALAMPGYVLAGASAVPALRRWLRPVAAALICCAAVMLTLPDLAWGVWGKVHPVHYPSDWPAVAAAINQRPATVAVLPAGTMRRFWWSGEQPVLDPLPRWLRADVLTTGDLTVSGVTVPGEGAHGRAVQRLLLSGADARALADAGVGWLVVERGTPGEFDSAAKTLTRLPVVHHGTDLILYRVGGQGGTAAAGHRRSVLVAHLVWLAMLVGAAAGAVVAGWSRRTGENVRTGTDR
ncbi:hypothetical protein MSP7336_00821 [Mycobacterium shimoidei]|uniref:Transmembrane protein n=1 Tax=Mycobacterium shimoidei TaxID=29313 RepID=A0A375YV01_MYCSH|nr:hypothetical protein MSP7336_00821 [Mycobacterium shimoidei]